MPKIALIASQVTFNQPGITKGEIWKSQKNESTNKVVKFNEKGFHTFAKRTALMLLPVMMMSHIIAAGGGTPGH